METRIGKALATLLLELQKGEVISYGTFQGSNQKTVDNMVNDNILVKIPISKKRANIVCRDIGGLQQHLANKYHIVGDLQAYIQLLEQDETERYVVSKTVKDEKLKKKRIFEGFLLNCYDEIWGKINGEKMLLKPQKGSFIFMNDFRNLQIDKDITIVCIENFENFKFIEEQKYLFHQIKPVFVWRYQNSGNSIAEWLKIIDNPYLHFGDFDLKGIHIYITEFRNKIGAKKCSFFIPPDILVQIRDNGLSERYDKQIELLKNFNFDAYDEIKVLAQFIHECKKGLPQEILIQ